MSIWMLVVFALSMLSAVFGFHAPAECGGVALPIFILTQLLFVSDIAVRGVRRPVV